WQGVLLCAEPLQYVSLAPISFIKATVVSAKIYIICLRKISEHSEPALANSFLISLDAEEGTAVQYARSLEQFTRHPVLVLRGGYKRFSACYHFLRTQKILWMPQELDNFQPYPVEILPAKLYMGNFKQACDQQIQKDLKIKAQVNISEQPLDHGAVLVFSSLGISRSSTATMAYLMHSCQFSLKRAWDYVLKCKTNMRPHRGFVKQLSDWETQIYGATITDISEPNY
uniref:Tyrosine-protein phosphatase domain-containing protein n=1 Tax=Buteo japonicus TaxID=224669 RepID=A0A8C0B2L1_9AVES